MIAKHKMMETVQTKMEVVKLFKTLMSRGLPFFWEEMDPLPYQKDYKECLVNYRLDHSKFRDMQQALSGKVIFDKLANDFELWFDFKAMCSKVPKASYLEVMELKAQAYDMVVVHLPGPNACRIICQYGSAKLKAHQ